MNKVILIGRLGQDAQQMDKAVRFTLATSDKVKGEDLTEWHNVVCVNANDKLCSLLKKGCLVAVEGKVTYNKTEKGTYCNILCFNVKILVYSEKQEPIMAEESDGLPF
jgi:single-stranded DNA-binding protein